MNNNSVSIKTQSDLDIIAQLLYEKTFGNRGSTEVLPELPDNPTKNETDIFNDVMWYWNIEKESYTISYKDYSGLNQELYGYFLKNENSTKTAILVHGWTGFSAEMGAWAKTYYDLGYNIFTPDLRGHGRSTENSINYGAIDSHDLVQWIDQCFDKEPLTKEVSLFGISMGAITVLGCIGLLNISQKQKLESICVESAFDDVYKLLILEFLNEPEVAELSVIDKILVFSKVDSILKQNQGFVFSDLLSPSYVKKIDCPTLVIHGAEDALDLLKVPFNIFSDVGNNRKQYYIIDNAGHAQCLPIDREGYLLKINEFLLKSKDYPLISTFNDSHKFILRNNSTKEALEIRVMDNVDGDISKKQTIFHVDFGKTGLYDGVVSVLNSKGFSSSEKISVIIGGGENETIVIPYEKGDPLLYVVTQYATNDVLLCVVSVDNGDGNIYSRGFEYFANGLIYFNVSDQLLTVDNDAHVIIYLTDGVEIRLPVPFA